MDLYKIGLCIICVIAGLQLDIVLSGKCPIVEIPNGRARYRSKGRSVRFRCLRGFTMIGPKMAICLKTKFWSRKQPLCVAQGCPALNLPPETITVTKFYRGGMAHFTCPSGHTRQGPGQIYCDGKNWSAEPPVCKEGMSLGCDFETEHYCGWTQDLKDDDLDWSWNKGPTGTKGTGPTVDHTLGTAEGHYLFLETSAPSKKGQKARLVSPVYEPKDATGLCMEFYYHIFGSTRVNDVGSLDVMIKPPKSRRTRLLFNIEGSNQGDVWHRQRIEMKPQTQPFQFIFQAKKANGWLSDIAIDDIRLYRCDEEKESPNATTTTTTTPSVGDGKENKTTTERKLVTTIAMSTPQTTPRRRTTTTTAAMTTTTWRRKKSTSEKINTTRRQSTSTIYMTTALRRTSTTTPEMTTRWRRRTSTTTPEMTTGLRMRTSTTTPEMTTRWRRRTSTTTPEMTTGWRRRTSTTTPEMTTGWRRRTSTTTPEMTTGWRRRTSTTTPEMTTGWRRRTSTTTPEMTTGWRRRTSTTTPEMTTGWRRRTSTTTPEMTTGWRRRTSTTTPEMTTRLRRRISTTPEMTTRWRRTSTTTPDMTTGWRSKLSTTTPKMTTKWQRRTTTTSEMPTMRPRTTTKSFDNSTKRRMKTSTFETTSFEHILSSSSSWKSSDVPLYKPKSTSSLMNDSNNSTVADLATDTMHSGTSVESTPSFFFNNDRNSSTYAHNSDIDFTTTNNNGAGVGKVMDKAKSTGSDYKQFLPLILGIVVAIILVAIVVALLAYKWNKKQRMKEEKEMEDQMNIISEYVDTTLMH